MGAFTFNGIDALDLSLKQVAELSPEEKENIIMAGANLIKEKLRQFLNTHHRRTGELADSIDAKYFSDGTAEVGPGGTRKKGKRRVARSHGGSGASKRSKHHGSASGSSMAEIGYYLEYGTPRMKATHWMEASNEQSMAEFDAAMERAWDEHLKRAGF